MERSRPVHPSRVFQGPTGVQGFSRLVRPDPVRRRFPLHGRPEHRRPLRQSRRSQSERPHGSSVGDVLAPNAWECNVFHPRRLVVLAVVCGIATGCGSRLDRQQLQAANGSFFTVGSRSETAMTHGPTADGPTNNAGPLSGGAGQPGRPTGMPDAALPGIPDANAPQPSPGGGQPQRATNEKPRTEQAPAGRGGSTSPERAAVPTPQTPPVSAPAAPAPPSGN